jgi:FtsP/CotA-like multicopper oxidase with cupredoxin domain
MMEQEKIAMVIKRLLKLFGPGLLALCMLAVTAGTASAATFYLRAAATDVTMPDATVVKMWGFASCDNTWACGSVTIPGPTLNVPFGDTTLTVNLKNDLTVPVSLVIPGQSITPTPTTVGGRVMSFTTETASGGGTNTYTWDPIKPGTYIYQSGTNPAVQVQMGLYGALKHDAANLNAYGVASTAYTNEVTLLFSEIDPTLHAAIDTAVTGGDWGTADFPSTIDFLPKYFLINGQAFTTSGSPPLSTFTIPAGNVGAKTLIRFLNAGLKDYVPLLQGLYMTILAEDGNLLPFSKSQYSLPLPAGKTMDAVITPTVAGKFPIYDRRLHLTNAQFPSGGMLRYLEIAAPLVAASAVSSITVTAPDGGETWKRGTKRLITWTYTGDPGAWVKIQLLRDGVLKQTILSSKSKGTGGSGSYNWTIPSRTATGGGYAVRITSTANSAYTDTSNTTFTITP